MSASLRFLIIIAFAVILTIAAPILMFIGVGFFYTLEKRSAALEKPNKFSEVLEIKEILASKRVDTWFGGNLQCHYEVARFSEASAAKFAERETNVIPYDGYSRRLRPTPMTPTVEMAHDEFLTYKCMLSEDPELAAIIEKAAHSEGNWFISDGVLIVPDHRIAAWGAYSY